MSDGYAFMSDAFNIFIISSVMPGEILNAAYVG